MLATLSRPIQQFIQLESAGGILLLGAAVLALITANSPLSGLYDQLLHLDVVVQVGALVIDKPLLLWINDGLMAIFFFLIGLEIKREFLEGELSSMDQVVLPAAGALGGMIVPAGIYAWFNWGDPLTLHGWAIPVATDIAFALGLLSSFGRRVPLGLKVFLLTLAIFDDLAAIIIIALFYTEHLSLGALVVGLVFLSVAALLNRLGVGRIPAYALIGIALWVAMLKSGVHATLAGVLLAFCIPMRSPKGRPTLRPLESDLHAPVAFVILPLFAFFNTGLTLSGMQWSDLQHPVTLGIVFGLLAGKPIGIMGVVWLVCILGFARLPANSNWRQMLGTALACGIGFTMSLFIAGLAFQSSAAPLQVDRLGILVGSVLAAVVAWGVLHLALPKKGQEPEEEEA